MEQDVTTKQPQNPVIAHLAEQYILRKGYRPVLAPEAVVLQEYCDVLLTYTDGLAFNMLLLGDKDSSAHKIAHLTPEVLEAVGIACGKYTGNVNRSKMPVGISIVQVGRHAAGEDEWRRLAALKKRVPRKYTVAAWDAATESRDEGSRQVRSTLLFNGNLGGTRFIKNALATPRMTADEMRTRQKVAFQEPGKPFVTWALLTVIGLVFLLELMIAPKHLGALMKVDIPTLLKMGAWAQDFALKFHEWYRLLTPAFLHGGLFHIAMNGFVLYMVGTLLEGFAGRAWTLALFFIGAIGGILMSWAVNDANIVAVGASGAIMAMIASAYVLSFRLPPGVASRSQIQMTLLQILIPSLVPLATSSVHVDVAAHIGGTLAGGIMGFILLKSWHREKPLPGARWLAGIFSALCIGYTVFGAVQLWTVFGSHHGM